jgi:hypothetical protein
VAFSDDEARVRAERVRTIGLFRYGLIREAADARLSTRQRGRMVRALAGLPKITGTCVLDRACSGWSGRCRAALKPRSCRHTTMGVSLDMSCGVAVEL